MFYTPVKLTEHRSKTPEGFLVISGCAIARTGFQLYSVNEVGLEPGPDGIIKIERDPEEVFAPEAMASAEGKDIVDNHPGVDVVPDNWSMLSRGHMQNIRRGTGIEDDLLLADLIFKHPDAIAAVEADPTQELSCGYESRYEIYGPGHAAQRQIRINHVAFLRNIPGRCGTRCAVRDSAMQPEGPDLWGQRTHANCSDILCSCGAETTHRIEDSAMRVVTDWMKRVKDAVLRDDKVALKAAMEDSDGIMKLTGDPEHNESTTHIHVHLGAPETTKPEGGLPETGEERVSSAKDNAGTVGGEHAATFGGKVFFADAETNAAFHEKMKGMEDSIEHIKKTCEDGFEEMKKHMDNMAEAAKTAGKQVDAAAGEEPAHEKANRKIEGELKEEAPQYTGDAIKARDSEMLVESFADTVRDAAILAPTISIPTFDSKLPTAQGYDTLCNLRKNALILFSASEDGKKVLSQVTRNLDFAGCSCREVTSTFRAAVAIHKAQTNHADMRSFSDSEKTGAGAGRTGPLSIADVQRMNEEHWAQQTAE